MLWEIRLIIPRQRHEEICFIAQRLLFYNEPQEDRLEEGRKVKASQRMERICPYPQF